MLLLDVGLASYNIVGGEGGEGQVDVQQPVLLDRSVYLTEFEAMMSLDGGVRGNSRQISCVKRGLIH